MLEAVEQPQQLPFPARAREQVSGDADEIRTAFGDPVDCTLAGARSAGRHTEVEVGQMRDPQPVELDRKVGDLHLEGAKAHPARLEPSVGDKRRRERDGDEQDRRGQTSSFSSTG
jgi:hypothetical protein